MPLCVAALNDRVQLSVAGYVFRIDAQLQLAFADVQVKPGYLPFDQVDFAVEIRLAQVFARFSPAYRSLLQSESI